jgi:hypothetical protein
VERFLTCKRVRQPAGPPEEVRGHDFVLPAWRRVSPNCKNVLAHRTPLTAALERLRRGWDNLSIGIARRTQLACSGLPPPGTASLSAYEHHLGHYPLGNICRQGSCTAFDACPVSECRLWTLGGNSLYLRRSPPLGFRSSSRNSKDKTTLSAHDLEAGPYSNAEK